MCEYERNKFVVISIDLLVFVLGISQMALVSIIINSDSFKSEFYIQYIHLWWNKPMFELRDSEGKQCNPDENNLVFGYLYGNREGCDCSLVSSSFIKEVYHNTIVKKRCTDAMIKAGSINVSSNPYIPLTKWKGKDFCIKSLINANEYYYYLQDSVQKNESCPSGFKDCGNLDELQKMCLRETLECPINNIIIDSIASHKDYNTTSLDSGFYFHYSNKEVNKSIIWSLKLSEGPPCIFKKELNSNSEKYILDFNYDYYNCKTTIGGYLYDKSFEKIDDIRKGDLYFDNGIEKEYFDALSGYPMSSLDCNINLYKEEFIGFSKKCIDDLQIHPNTLIDYFDSHKSYSDLLITIATFCSISLLIFISNSIFKIIFKYNTESCMNCFDYVYSITQIIIVSISSSTYSKYKTDFEISYSCDNQQAKELLNEVWIHLEHEKDFMVIIIIFGAIPLFLYLGNYTIVYFIDKFKCNHFDKNKSKVNNEETKNGNEENPTEENRDQYLNSGNRLNHELDLIKGIISTPKSNYVNNDSNINKHIPHKPKKEE